MAKHIKSMIVVASLFLFAGCSSDDSQSPQNTEPVTPGVVLTFDDVFADDWYNADQVLSAYNWKATFFITKYNEFTQTQKNELQSLKTNGHEIASHGLKHLKATEYVTTYGIDRYIQDEILPLNQMMSLDGYTLKTFAYPYGDRNSALDNELLRHFDIIRGTTYGQLPPEQQSCFYTGKRVIYGLGTDQSYGNGIDYLKSLMQYAHDHNKIVIFYGHQIVQSVSGNYQTPISKLEELCDFANALGLKFYTVSELRSLHI